MSDWTEMNALALGDGIGRGEIDAAKLTETFLEKIDEHPLRDRIYARVTADRARAEAKAAAERARIGRRRSRLDGVPVSWKDLFDTAGIATEAGSAMLAGRVPSADARVLRNGAAMGLVCLGKTHMSELAFSGLGLNPVTATPPCVNDQAAVPGGSSSGAAASVAFGLAAAAIGSDTGGSVRVPSAWNDLVGLKTTSGRLPLEGVVPLAKGFDTVGPLCRDVADAAALFAALDGVQPPVPGRAGGLSGRRFARLRTIVEDDLSPAIAEAYETVLAKLRAAGAEIVDFDFPALEGPMGDAGVLYTAEAWAEWGALIDEKGDLMFGAVRSRFAAGKEVAAATFLRAVERMKAVRAEWARATAGVDAVLCPTTPNLPPEAERLMTDGEYYVSENLRTLRNTRVGNLMGLAGVSLPTGTPSAGLLLNGAPWGESRLLRVAAETERALA
jgi:aspartyl-tRNA(Asn)/glutamyl-tRNA(Gln) amidotransferase subunit A